MESECLIEGVEREIEEYKLFGVPLNQKKIINSIPGLSQMFCLSVRILILGLSVFLLIADLAEKSLVLATILTLILKMLFDSPILKLSQHLKVIIGSLH